jgi:hypothetical protein
LLAARCIFRLGAKVDVPQTFDTFKLTIPPLTAAGLYSNIWSAVMARCPIASVATKILVTKDEVWNMIYLN